MKLSSNLSAQRAVDHHYPYGISTLLPVILATILLLLSISSFAEDSKPFNEANESDTKLLTICADPVINPDQEDRPCYTVRKGVLA